MENSATTSAHFICVDSLNIRPVTKGGAEFNCGDWDVSQSDAEALVGGLIHFHNKKSDPSYFGGRVERYKLVETDRAHKQRIVFTITSLKECKGVKWNGRSDVNAWCSGVLK